jgi:hypothetical protein
MSWIDCQFSKSLMLTASASLSVYSGSLPAISWNLCRIKKYKRSTHYLEIFAFHIYNFCIGIDHYFMNELRSGSAFGIVTTYGLHYWGVGVRVPADSRILTFFILSRPALRSTQPPTEAVGGVSFLGAKAAWSLN